jgi:type II secretory pathway pseudopilin PulG
MPLRSWARGFELSWFRVADRRTIRYYVGAMKRLSSRGAAKAMTLVEVLLVIGVLAILLVLLLPALASRPRRSRLIPCLNNQKQIGLALSLFSADNNAQFPPQVSITNGGSMEFIGSNRPALHFRTLPTYLGGNWRVWHCPADQFKQPLTTNSVITERNLSYFISVDATLALTNAIHTGDRNLEVAGQPVAPGLFTLTTNTAVGWTRDMHKVKHNFVWVECGNLLFVDGHVQRFQADLPAAIHRQDLATNRLAVP